MMKATLEDKGNWDKTDCYPRWKYTKKQAILERLKGKEVEWCKMCKTYHLVMRTRTGEVM